MIKQIVQFFKNIFLKQTEPTVVIPKKSKVEPCSRHRETKIVKPKKSVSKKK